CNPAPRVERADDTRIGASRVCELLGRLAADVGAEKVVDGLLARRVQDWKLKSCRHEREPEVEVKDIRGREEPQKGPPLHELAPPEPALAVEAEIDVALVRPERLVLEGDEPGIDALAAQCLDVLPRNAGHVDRRVDGGQPVSSHST